MSITRDDWLSALNEAGDPPDPDAITSSELAEMLHIGMTATRRRIRELLANRKARRVWKYVTSSAGTRTRVTAYRLLK